MKIYIATSWKLSGPAITLARILRSVGHEVDCFCDDSTGRFVFAASPEARELDAREFLSLPDAQKAFAEDKKWLDWAEVCILITPSGRSAHLEAGYAVGAGKRLYIIGDFPQGEFDVMYGFASGMYRWADYNDLSLLIAELRAISPEATDG